MVSPLGLDTVFVAASNKYNNNKVNKHNTIMYSGAIRVRRGPM